MMILTDLYSIVKLGLVLSIIPFAFIACDSDEAKSRGLSEIQEQTASNLEEVTHIDTINQLDSSGRKIGLWIDSSLANIVHKHYKNGVLNGMFAIYYTSTNSVYGTGQYADGIKVGVWIGYRENGSIWVEEDSISKNDITVLLDDGVLYKHIYKSYVKYYGNKGKVSSEGSVLFDESPEMEGAKWATWKYYTEEGKIIRKEIYKKQGLVQTMRY